MAISKQFILVTSLAAIFGPVLVDNLSPSAPAGQQGDSFRPSRVTFPEKALSDLRARLIATKGLEQETVNILFDVKNASIPVPVSVFPNDISAVSRSWAERAFPKLSHYNKLHKDEHFAAWEEAAAFTEDLRNGFRPLRSDKATPLKTQRLSD